MIKVLDEPMIVFVTSMLALYRYIKSLQVNTFFDENLDCGPHIGISVYSYGPIRLARTSYLCGNLTIYQYFGVVSTPCKV